MPREQKTINIEVGCRIKARRGQLRISREELARRTGYSSNFVQEVERGRSGLSSESLCAFSRALDVSADKLLFGSERRSYDHLLRKLDQVPDEKLGAVLRVLDAAIDCVD